MCSRNLPHLGLSLADGKALIQQLQQVISGAQADELCNLHRVRQCCHRWNPIKDYRLRKIDTVKALRLCLGGESGNRGSRAGVDFGEGENGEHVA